MTDTIYNTTQSLRIRICGLVQAMEEIVHASHWLDRMDSVKALIITGEGNKAFAAGADIKEMASQSYSEVMLSIKLWKSCEAFTASLRVNPTDRRWEYYHLHLQTISDLRC